MGSQMNEENIPVDFNDPINAKILAVSEDRLQGFQQDPLGAIVRESGVEIQIVIEIQYINNSIYPRVNKRS